MVRFILFPPFEICRALPTRYGNCRKNQKQLRLSSHLQIRRVKVSPARMARFSFMRLPLILFGTRSYDPNDPLIVGSSPIPLREMISR